jgi:uncharacterized RDD family membrane protein YckC
VEAQADESDGGTMTQSGSTGSSGGAGWTKPPTPAQTAQPGPAGFVYGDVPNRVIAYIIDSIVIFIVNVIILAILVAIGLNNFVVYGLIGLVVSAGYFIYLWSTRRATLGMGFLGLQIGNAVDGKTLTTDQALRRWVIISAPAVVAQAAQVIGIIGSLLGLLALLWYIYLLWTTAKSPTKQGFHDVFANTMVVKAARSAG